MSLKHWSVWVLALWILAAIVASFVDFHPNQIHLDLILAKPSFGHLSGFDDLGRAILPRLIASAKVSLMVVALVTAITASVGIMLGMVSGYYGGWVDRTLMQITDVFLAFPGILLAIAFAAVLGAGLSNLILALCITSWVGYARLTRAQVLSLRQRQHVMAAESLGASTPRIMLKHMLPLLGAPLLVEATYSMGGLAIAEASLSFLGLGIQAPNSSWGAMLRDGVRYMLIAPHYVLAVGLSLMSLVLAVNVLGDRLRDYLDVRG